MRAASPGLPDLRPGAAPALRSWPVTAWHSPLLLTSKAARVFSRLPPLTWDKGIVLPARRLRTQALVKLPSPAAAVTSDRHWLPLPAPAPSQPGARPCPQPPGAGQLLRARRPWRGQLLSNSTFMVTAGSALRRQLAAGALISVTI